MRGRHREEGREDHLRPPRARPSSRAARSPATASHLPRLLARLEALDRDPVTSLARLAEVVTVAPGTAARISFCTAAMSLALVAAT